MCFLGPIPHPLAGVHLAACSDPASESTFVSAAMECLRDCARVALNLWPLEYARTMEDIRRLSGYGMTSLAEVHRALGETNSRGGTVTQGSRLPAQL